MTVKWCQNFSLNYRPGYHGQTNTVNERRIKRWQCSIVHFINSSLLILRFVIHC